MISLAQLIDIAPFPKEKKDEFIGKLPNLSEDAKFDIASICWDVILEDYQNKITLRQSEYLYNCVAKNEPISDEGLKKISDDLFNELAQKLDAVDQEEKLGEIREQIEIHSKNNSN